MYRGVEGALGAAKREQAKKIKNVLKTKKELKSIDDPFTGPGEPARKSGTKSKSGKYFIPDPPPMPKNLHDPCRLDIRLETVTRLQAKPRVMYTFVCAQEFRRYFTREEISVTIFQNQLELAFLVSFRDEFGSHSKNIHSDILGGLNNWLEHRCPLASYGCNYSARKLFPHNLNHTIRFSPAVEGFGIMIVGAHNSEPTTSKSSSSRRPENLLDLPVEILMQILGRLDSFS